jgi:2-polyprenyl-6-methoxyphenol hydroxylase-like FAD-dependent oxidoreductase
VEDFLIFLFSIGCALALALGLLGLCVWIIRAATRQQDKANKLIERGDEQMDQTQRQLQRTDAVLTRWEQIADRAEALLARWEGQDRPPSRNG